MIELVAKPGPDRRATAEAMIRSGSVAADPTITAGTIVRDPEGEPLMVVARLTDPDVMSRLRWGMRSLPADTVVRGHGSRSSSRAIGYGARQVVMQRNCCREAKAAEAGPEAHAAILASAPALAGILADQLPDLAARDVDAAQVILPEWRIADTPWTSGIVNWTAPLPYHYDRNNLTPVWSAMVVARRGVTGGHLHVPELDAVVECRDGDVVLFPGWRFVHGVTPMKVARGGYRMTAVFYCVSRMRHCLPYDEELARGRADRTEREEDLRPVEERIPERPDAERGIRRGPNPPELAPPARHPRHGMVTPGRPEHAVDLPGLVPGLDFRRPEWRRETFLRFYEFHVEHRAHPGAVYQVIPWLAEVYGWTTEEALWFAFINGNTQNPVTSLIIWRRFPTPDDAPAMVSWFDRYRPLLAFDTDRRHHRTKLGDSTRGYVELLDGHPQADLWARAADGGWPDLWATANRIPTFGRLSAWSYLEYLSIAGVPVDAPTLLLEDRDGSRSHRNGLALVLGRDDLDWHRSNPRFDGRYPPDVIDWMEEEGARLLHEARTRIDNPAVGNLTLESALCTYKGWHRPNRRYPNVYSDLLHDRIRSAQERWPDEDLDVLWAGRWRDLPPHLRLEDRPRDPGCAPRKQNHYLNTGQVVSMGHDWPCFTNDLDTWIEAG